MTAPTPYDLAYSFQAYQVSNPARPLPADKIEAEFNAITLTTDQIIANLGLIQRSDNALANESVGYDQLKDELLAGFREPTVWLTATAYERFDSVYSGASIYRALSDHTSGVFATDYSGGKWELMLTLDGGAGLQPLDSDLTAIAALTTTSYGRSFLELANAAAARTLAGVVIGTDVQAYDADLTTWAGLTPSANAQSLVTAASYAAMRTLLDLEAGTDFYSISAADAAFQPKDSDLTVIAGLADPNADRILFWDDSAGAYAYLVASTGLTITTTNITVNTASETVVGIVEMATTAEAAALSDTTRAVTSAGLAAAMAGKKAIWIDASAMRPRATSSAGFSDYDSGSNDLTLYCADFDTTTQEYAHFKMAMPDIWNEGTVTFKPYWTNTGGASTETVVFSLAGAAFSNDDGINGTAFGTVQTSTDTWLAQNDLHVGPESSAITIAGTPAAGDMVVFQVSRVVGSDNMAGDARLIGLMLYVTTNAFNEP